MVGGAMPEMMNCGHFKPCVWRAAHRKGKPATSMCVAFDGVGDPCLAPAKAIEVEVKDPDQVIPDFAFCDYHIELLKAALVGPGPKRRSFDEPPRPSINIPEVEPNEPWLSREGHVYFARFGDLVKIGYSMNPERRIAQIEQSLPRTLDEWVSRPGTPADEKFYHRRFKAHRQKGEWFTITPEIEQTMDALKLLDTA